MKHGVKPEADLLNSCNRTLESDLNVRTVEYLFIFTVASNKENHSSESTQSQARHPLPPRPAACWHSKSCDACTAEALKARDCRRGRRERSHLGR